MEKETENLSATEYLVATAGLGLRGAGADDNRVASDREAQIVDIFERYLAGDGASGLFRWASGSVYEYDGRRYARREPEYLKFVIKEVMRLTEVGGVYRANSVNKTFAHCKTTLEFGKWKFEPDRRYAVFSNCVLDLETGGTLAFSHEYATDVYLDFDYDPSARSFLWDKFVLDTIPSDEMREAFQMFCGAFFVDRSKHKLEKACYLIGSGRNGKSVLVNAIADTLGADMVSSFSPQQLFTDNSCIYNRAAVDGKLVNFSDDVKASDYSGGDFKQFVSGKPFEARRIFGSPFTMRSVPFMVMCVNAMPPTTDDTAGHYRRILPIMCPNNVSEREADPQLEGKLRSLECRQAIFNWMYEGYKMFKDNGYKITEGLNIKEIQDELKADSNSARRWLRDVGYRACDPDGDTRFDWVSMRKIMEDYRKYCVEMSEPVKSQKSVGMILRELGFPSKRQSDGVYYCVEPPEDSDIGDAFDSNLPF